MGTPLAFRLNYFYLVSHNTAFSITKVENLLLFERWFEYLVQLQGLMPSI